MNPLSNSMPEFPAGSQGVTSEAVPATRPMYWSVRRELWENRSIYIAPLAVAGAVLFGFLISTITLPHRMRALSALDAGKQRAAVAMPYSVAAGLIMATAFIVGVFYCLDALHGERRDRSILFWKSLPVSDRTTVLSKAGIPLVVLPLFSFAIVLTTQVMILTMSTVALLGNGPGLTTLWTYAKFFQSTLALIYGLIAVALWHAPLYGWLLLVSGWARRATFLWAVLPPLAICVFEAIAFRTSYFAKLLGYRVIGFYEQAFVPHVKGTVAIDPLTALTPGNYLSTPGLWIGLALAAVFLTAAVRLRRNREPI
jgi:ABC-2 type transport system permease protein